MREIKFRGKNTINGSWVFGHYFLDHGINRIHSEHTIYPIHPKSIGQSTGFSDKNENEIYEGDIIGDWSEVDGKKIQSKLQVYFDELTGQWMVDLSANQDKSYSISLFSELGDFEYEILGNIHDNIELLNYAKKR